MKISRSSRRRQVAKSVQPTLPKPMPAAALSGGVLEAVSTDVDEALDRALQLIAATRSALLAAKAQLEAIVRDSTDPTEQAEASAELLRVEPELELLRARRAVLVGGTATLKPPGDAEIAEAQRIAGELAQDISGSARVAAIASLAAGTVRLSEQLLA
ncbi:MAG: hypothetical protein Q7U26_03625 [Aquabacterium sp.]|nr:hypothetical protein [Aquabacterium sp.]